MRDLTSPHVLHLKGVLFLLLGVVSAACLICVSPTIQTALLLGICIWAFCRFYYWAFYVIEHYADPRYRFAGLISVLWYILGRDAARVRARRRRDS